MISFNYLPEQFICNSTAFISSSTAREQHLQNVSPRYQFAVKVMLIRNYGNSFVTHIICKYYALTDASGSNNRGMTIPVKELLQLEKNYSQTNLNIVYFSQQLPKGRALSVIQNSKSQIPNSKSQISKSK